MNTIIELHDSRIAEISTQQGAIIVRLSPAYLHKSEGRPGFDPGTGWTQDAQLTFEGASISGKFPDLPCDVMDGELILGGEAHNNQIPMPLASSAFAELQLIFDSIHAVTITGRGVRLELLDKPRHVEEFRP